MAKQSGEFAVNDGHVEVKRKGKWQPGLNFTLEVTQCVCGGPDGNGMFVRIVHGLDGDEK